MRRRMAQRVKSYLSWRIFAMALGVLVLVSFAVHGQRNPPSNTHAPFTVRGTPPVTILNNQNGNNNGSIFDPHNLGIVVQDPYAIMPLKPFAAPLRPGVAGFGGIVGTGNTGNTGNSGSISGGNISGGEPRGSGCSRSARRTHRALRGR